MLSSDAHGCASAESDQAASAFLVVQFRWLDSRVASTLPSEAKSASNERVSDAHGCASADNATGRGVFVGQRVSSLSKPPPLFF